MAPQKGRRLDLYTRQRIVNMRKRGVTYANIVRRLQEEDGVQVERHSVSNCYRRFLRTGLLAPGHGGGQKSRFTTEHKDFIDKTMEENNETTAEDLRRGLLGKFPELQKISDSSLSRIRRKLGWTCKGTRYCQIVTEKNRKERLAYAIKCLRAKETFHNVIFCDEAKVEMECHATQQWRREGHPLHKCLRPKAKHPYKVNVYAAISARGATKISIFTGNMDSVYYQHILSTVTIPFVREKYGPDHRFYQDNDSKHTSKSTQEYMAKEGLNWWRSPPESPDLNPIENLWHQMKNHLRRHVKPKTKEQLVDGILKFWETVTPQLCQRYIQHVRKVLPVVVIREGRATGY